MKRKARAYPKVHTGTIQLIREVSDNPVVKISRSDDVFKLLRDVQQRDRESFFCLHLNTKNEVMAIDEVSRGTVNQSLVHPREVFKAAILSNAHTIIIAHNHPSGDPTPSRQDRDVTRRLVQAGELLGIRILDHVIVGYGDYHSFADNGELDCGRRLS
ncbi:DNA repair protein RadC [bacterium]|nr:DNA repair protein RadC [bacterium]